MYNIILCIILYISIIYKVYLYIKIEMFDSSFQLCHVLRKKDFMSIQRNCVILSLEEGYPMYCRRTLSNTDLCE